MILKGNQRGGAKQLAYHLLRTDENEHVELHEVRGFLSESLHGALHEAYAVSRGTKCTQFLFSLSLSPPQAESVSIEVFEGAIDAIEQKLGLAGQPRAIVFHEKEGRRHAHCVWSRIDADQMKAINLPHYKLKLRDVSKELYLDNGWQMPRGLVDSEERDPANFTREEWQQAKRAGHDPKTLKLMFQECWAISDGKAAFASALQERGYYLARGDRRGYVAVDFQGEIYAIAKWTGLRTKDVRARLGEPEMLPSVAETKAKIAERMTAALQRQIDSVTAERRSRANDLAAIRNHLTQRHRKERERLRDIQAARSQMESVARAQRLSRGLKGLWDRLTGKYRRIRERNEFEASLSIARDQSEQQALIDRQLEDRRVLQCQIQHVRRTTESELADLKRDLALYGKMDREGIPTVQVDFQSASADQATGTSRRRNRTRGFGPEM